MSVIAQPSKGTVPAGDPPAFSWVEPVDLAGLPESLLIVDVRTPGEYFGPGPRLRGSELIPLSDLGCRARSWAADQELLLVCDSGGRSARAAGDLALQGFVRVRVLRGGLRAGSPSWGRRPGRGVR